MTHFPQFFQPDAMDCGPIRQGSDKHCLRMIAKLYGKSYTIETSKDKSFTSKE